MGLAPTLRVTGFCGVWAKAGTETAAIANAVARIKDTVRLVLRFILNLLR
jgi:hypothetical protein